MYDACEGQKIDPLRTEEKTKSRMLLVVLENLINTLRGDLVFSNKVRNRSPCQVGISDAKVAFMPWHRAIRYRTVCQERTPIHHAQAIIERIINVVESPVVWAPQDRGLH